MRAELNDRHLRLSVTEFVALFAERGIGFSTRGGSRAAWLGSALHARYQAEAISRVPGYRAEVPLRRRERFGEWTLELRGRCDGLRPCGDEGTPWVVEELKSGRRPPQPGSRDLAAFELQAELYAWMASELLEAPCRAEWVWIPAGGGAVAHHPIVHRPDTLRVRMAETVTRLVARLEREEAVRRARREAAAAVRFPFPRRRSGQREIEDAVERALEQGEQLLLQAPTGIGKTAAVLTPVVRHVLASGRRAFVASASTLQQHGVMRTLAAIAPPGLTLAGRIRAKRRMCATDTMLCHPLHCDFAADYGQRVRTSGVLERCTSNAPLVEPSFVFDQAVGARVCPFELSLDASDRLPVTVGDANYVFDPVVALPRWSDPDELGDAVLVIDEAHRLPARARDALSTAISAQDAWRAAELAALGSAPVHRQQRAACERLAAWIQDEVVDTLGAAEGSALREPDAERAAAVAAELDLGVEATLTALDGAAAEGPHRTFLELAWKLFWWQAEPLGDHARVAVRDTTGERLERWCLDPAPALAPVFGAAAAVVTLSATLSPPDLHAALLGLDRDRLATSIITGESGAERRRIVIEPRYSTRFVDRAETTPRLARSLSALLDEVPGNALILGPSYRALGELGARLAPARHRIRLQAADDGERERTELLDELRDTSDLAVCAVAGGALAEGVDTAALGLRLVAVVGPCLPGVDARSRLLVEHYDERFGAGFEMAVALPGMTRVIQSAGRLLRRDEDFGLVVLYGGRFLRTPYRDWLPEDWLEGAAPEDLVAEPSEAARQFFASRGTRDTGVR